MTSAVVRASPGVASSTAVEAVLQAAVALGGSPLLQGTARAALKDFLCALCASGCAAYSLPKLRARLLDAGAGASRTPQRNLSECIAALCVGNDGAARETLAQCIDTVQSPEGDAARCFALLLIGEIGRVADLAAVPEVERIVTDALAAPSEEVKATASLALGGVASGSLPTYLPFLLRHISESDATSPKQLYLLLKSLNEVLRTCLDKRAPLADEQREHVTSLLLGNMEVEEECRAMVADCLAQLAFMAPGPLVAALHGRLADASPTVRCGVVSALRHTLHDERRNVDTVLQQHMLEFLRAMTDADHNVRKEAVQLLNSLAHARPALLAPVLPEVLPWLFALTTPDPALVRTVELGPFKQKVDDGLGVRKYTFECLEALLTRFGDRLDYADFLGALEAGLADDRDIRRGCHAMLVRAAAAAPSAVLARLSALIVPLQKTLATRIKTDAIKQEVERHEELLRSCLAAIYALDGLPSVHTIVPAFKTFLERCVLSQKEMNERYQEVQDSVKRAA